jgi:Histidine kinase
MDVPEPGAKYADRLLTLLRRRAPTITAFVVLMMLFDATRSWSMNDASDGLIDGLLTSVRVNWILILFAALAPYLVEAANIRPAPRAALSVLVTFLVVAIPALFFGFAYEGPITAGVRDGRLLSNATFLVRSCWLYSVAGLLFAAYCQTRDREIETIRAAREAELERASAQRNIMASRLQVLQARVEPELLFGALGDVRAAYLLDPGTAESLLDDLIVYLRAALPQMRGGTSTLQREAALAEAYLKVVPAGRSGRLSVAVQIAEAVGASPFPPMVLLPLAHAASEASPQRIQIVAMATPATTDAPTNFVAMRVTTPHLPEGWKDAELLAIRGALQNHFGADATLQIEYNVDHVSAIATWAEHEDAPAPPTPSETVAPA